MPRSPAALFELSRQALGTTQVGLGKLFGVARRTAQRWSSSGVPSYHLPQLAAYVHPHDAKLAAEIALSAGTTLEALGLVTPQPETVAPVHAPSHAIPPARVPPAPPMLVPPMAARPSPTPLPPAVVEAVVCACAEAMDLSPRQVRPGLHAAFAVALEIGLDVQTAERGLRAKLPSKT
jgi:hypothetical protein